MRLSDIIKMGIMNLWRRKGRTILTIIGVIIGSISVVLMVSIALGSERAEMEVAQSFGNIRVVQIMNWNSNYYKYYQDEQSGSSEMAMAMGMGGEGDAKKLTEESVKTMEAMEHVEAVMPYYRADLEFKVGRERSNSELIACDIEKLKLMGFELGRGRIPEPEEKAIITFPELGHNFYDPHSRINRWGESDVEIYGETLNVFMINDRDKKGNKKRPMRLESVGETKDMSEYGWQCLMDIKTFKSLLIQDIRRYGNYNAYRRDKNKDNYSGIKILVDNTENVVAVTKSLKEMGYEAENQMEWIESIEERTKVMKLVLGGIGFVALLVAAIGITNTMVMAIYERTREIGVMKVLGAEVRDILKLFLFEAAFIGLLGGSLGTGFSYLGSHFINVLAASSEFMPMGMDLSYIPLWLSVSSIIFSSLIGVVAGIIPAIRATRLSALEAIKTQ